MSLVALHTHTPEFSKVINIDLQGSMGVSKELMLLLVIFINFHIINTWGLINNLKLHEAVNELKNLETPDMHA